MVRTLLVATMMAMMSRSARAEDVQSLTEQARTMARDGHCSAVAVIEQRVVVLDQAFHERVFATDPVIAQCASPSARAGGTATWLPFVSLDRQLGRSHFGIELSHLFVQNAPFDQIARIDIHGEYTNRCGNGIYLTVPFGYRYLDNVVPADLEAGAVVTIHTSEDVRVVMHGGLTAPTQSRPEEGDAGLIGLAAGQARLGDLALAMPSNFAARIGVSPIVTSGAALVRVDLGADITLHAPTPYYAASVDASYNQSTFHIGVGAGEVIGHAGIAGEAVLVAAPWISGGLLRASVALSARYRIGAFLPYLSAQAQVVSASSDDPLFNVQTPLSFTAGIEYQPD